jgi:uncharacterized protein
MATAAHVTDGRENRAPDHSDWIQQTRVFLQPIAAPSILGLFAFAAATFVVSTNMAGWYGTPLSGLFLFPFVAVFGGIAQFAAAMWAYRARDGLATAMHGTWGSFWIAYGVLYLLAAVHVLPVPVGKFPAFGFWFLALAAITAFGTIAALGENLGFTGVLATLTVGSAFAAIHYLTGVHSWMVAAGWVLFASSVIATYVAGALMIATSWGRTVLPLGEYRRAANVPGRRPIRTLEYELGEPGVKHGQ